MKKYVTGLPRLRNSFKVHRSHRAQAVEILCSGLELGVGALLPVPVERKLGASERLDLMLPATVRGVFLVF